MDTQYHGQLPPSIHVLGHKKKWESLDELKVRRTKMNITRSRSFGNESVRGIWDPSGRTYPVSRKAREL